MENQKTNEQLQSNMQLSTFPPLLQPVIANLPKELQDIILSPKFDDKLRQLVANQPLDETQFKNIRIEILIVLMGIENSSQLVTNIAHKARISRERAEAIAKNVRQEIFAPVADLLTDGGPSPQQVTLAGAHARPDSGIVAKPQQLTQKPFQATKPRQIPPDVVVQNTSARPQAHPAPLPKSDVFANKLVRPTLVRNKEEQVETEMAHEKPKHVDPYREPIE